MELSKEIVTLVLGTGLVSAFITALFSKFQSDKNHKIENITKERKEWRDCIRRIVLDVVEWERVKKETATSISILNILYALFFSIVTLFFLRMPFGMDLEFIDSGILLIIFLFLICCIELFKYQPKYDFTFKLSNIFSSRNKFK
jgi:hypothetical protein